MALLAGVARADVTPPVGIMMAGYASRTTPAVGIYDDLVATALYLEQDGVCVGIVSLDLIQLPAAEVAEVRSCCEALAGIPGANVFVASSHTHGGPVAGPGAAGGLRAAYAETVRWKVAGALAEARRNAGPARLGHARKEALVAGNRRERTPKGVILGYNPDGPMPRATDVLRLDRAETGEPLAILFHYACHGTTLGGDNYLLTADYMGFARRAIEREFPGTRAMFLAGCGGDQNPYPRGTFAQAERHGRSLGAAVIQAELDIQETRDPGRLAVVPHPAALPLADLPSPERAQADLAAAEAAVAAERGAAEERARAAGAAFDPEKAVSWTTGMRLKSAQERLAAIERGETDLKVPIEVQAVALGEIGLVSLPAEVFFEIGEEIRRQSPFAITLPVSYANGAIGYVPTQAEVPAGGYEIEHARARRHGLFLRDDADAALIEAAVAALRGAAA